MPIFIKGSGGVQKTPTFNTNNLASSGKIVATAGNKSATLTLSSSYDSDFVSANIVSGKTIFGVTGTAEKVFRTTKNGSGSNKMVIKPTESVSDKTLLYCAIAAGNGVKDTGGDCFAELVWDYHDPTVASYTYYDESSDKFRWFLDNVEVNATSSGFSITVTEDSSVEFSSDVSYICFLVYK